MQRALIPGEEALDRFAGRSVAVVGNAPQALAMGIGPEIDGHEEVVRMNGGAPLAHHAPDIGSRTTVLTCALLSCLDESLGRGCAPEDVWWMKLTPLGRRELPHVRADARVGRLFLWPQNWEDECEEFVGANPSSGMRVLWALVTKARPLPSSVLAAGFGFGSHSWWKDVPRSSKRGVWPRRGAVCHSGGLEREAVERLGFKREGDLTWAWATT